MKFTDRAIDLVADDKIRAAVERGEFAHLPGLGKPHPIIDEPYDPNWWVRRKLAAEDLGGRAGETAD
ncbi:MAG: DnaJ family domain-containing protein [Pirellulales bacterium]